MKFQIPCYVAALSIASLIAADYQKPFASIMGEGGQVENSALALSPDGKLLVAGGRICPWGDAGFIGWNVETGREAFRHSFKLGPPRSAAFSHDGTTLAVGGDNGELRIYDLKAGKESGSLQGHRSGIARVAFTPNDAILVTCSGDCQVRAWDAKTHKPLSAFRFESVHTGGFADAAEWKRFPDRPHEKPPLIVRFDHKANDRVTDMAIAPDGKHVAIAIGTRTALIVELATGKLVNDVDAEKGSEILSLAYSHDGKLLVFGCASKKEDVNPIEVRRVEDGERVFFGDGHDSPVFHVTFSPDDGHLLTGAGRRHSAVGFEGKETRPPQSDRRAQKCPPNRPGGRPRLPARRLSLVLPQRT